MTVTRCLLALAGALVIAAGPAAAQTPAPPEPLGVRIDVVTHLGLDAKRASQVETIMAEGRGKLHAKRGDAAEAQKVRAETEKKLAGVLTAEEMKRLKALLPATKKS